MPREEYQRELDLLRSNVGDMADLVLDRYDDALDAYETGDVELAKDVIEGDHEVNEQYLDLEADCIDLFALHQPVAGDLRFIASSFKIVTDLERIGDLATNLAGYATQETNTVLSPTEVISLGNTAKAMVADAVGAYRANDAQATWRIASRDTDLDEACREASERAVRKLIVDDTSMHTDAEIEVLLADVSRTLLTIRDIERVGDHSVNICARTLYMIENDEGLIY